MTDPIRVQLKRTKGWRKPPNTIVVARPSKWGNPFTIGEVALHLPHLTDEQCRAVAVIQFRDWLTSDAWCMVSALRTAILANLGELRGKNLACWCPLDQPCRADVLLELAKGRGQ